MMFYDWVSKVFRTYCNIGKWMGCMNWAVKRELMLPTPGEGSYETIVSCGCTWLCLKTLQVFISDMTFSTYLNWRWVIRNLDPAGQEKQVLLSIRNIQSRKCLKISALLINERIVLWFFWQSTTLKLFLRRFRITYPVLHFWYYLGIFSLPEKSTGLYKTKNHFFGGRRVSMP